MAGPMDDQIYMASIYRLTGVNFWQSAKTLSETIEVDDSGAPTSVTALPFYFLASHATELLLKSALLKRGFSDRELKHFSYRHNLEALLAAFLGTGVNVKPETANLVRHLSAQHKTHGLRYSALVDDGQPTYLPAGQRPVVVLRTKRTGPEARRSGITLVMPVRARQRLPNVRLQALETEPSLSLEGTRGTINRARMPGMGAVERREPCMQCSW